MWLVVVYCWFKIASDVMTVGANSAATELFPAALRTTMIGAQGITAAAFSMLAQVLIAALNRTARWTRERGSLPRIAWHSERRDLRTVHR